MLKYVREDGLTWRRSVLADGAAQHEEGSGFAQIFSAALLQLPVGVFEELDRHTLKRA